MEGGERDQLRDEFIDIPKPIYQNYMNSQTCEVKYLLKKQIREGGRRKEERCSVLIYTDQTYPSDIEKYEQKWKIENKPRFLAYFLISLTVIVIILCYHHYHNYHFFIIFIIIISVFIFIILQSAPLYLLKTFGTRLRWIGIGIGIYRTRANTWHIGLCKDCWGGNRNWTWQFSGAPLNISKW